jgi:hypothetical protein
VSTTASQQHEMTACTSRLLGLTGQPDPHPISQSLPPPTWKTDRLWPILELCGVQRRLTTERCVHRMRTGKRLFSWSRSGRTPDKILDDRKYLEARARRLLNNYLVADSQEKQRHYEVIAGAAAACQPGIADPMLQDPDLAAATAEAALNVVMAREHQAVDSNDPLATLITDAYATVAVAYRRASTLYTVDDEMQKLGTAAVHLLTMAAHMHNKSKHNR